MSKRTVDSELESRPLLSATAWKQVAAAYVHENGNRVSQDAAISGCMSKLEDGKRVRSSFANLDGDRRGGIVGGFGSEVNRISQARADAGVALHTAELLFQKDESVHVKSGADEVHEEAHGRTDGFKDDAARSRNLALQKSVSQGVRQAQLLQQQQTLLAQAPAVRWERFLPQRQLRVLLAEDDDSTRHVVTALLRNCSYEVTSAANGLLAWELLIAQTIQVDLVLTEVVMPCLSGIGLLSRIVSHQAFKHIPVIMMSSHDSMNIVFKCLSRGAVDFLVKPVRKNELKNLWQHVWRRCHSSSGSGSGSGSQTQKASRAEGAADCNNSGSMDENDNASSDLSMRGGSDNGSGTQGSWTKGNVEVESSYPEKNCPPSSDNLRKKGFDDVLDKDVEMATLRLAAADPSNVQIEDTVPSAPSESLLPLKCLEATSEKDNGSGSSQEGSQKAIDLIGVIASKDGDKKEEQAESRDEDLLEKHASNSLSSKDKGASDFGSPAALLELTLKRPRQFEDDNKDKDGRHVLRHSCSSAFSRYNNTTSHQTPLVSENTSSTQHCKHGSHPSVLASDAGSNGPSFAPLAATGAGSPVPIMSHAYQTASRQEKTFSTGKGCVPVKEEAVSANHNTPSAGQTHSPVPPGGSFYDGIPHCFTAINHPIFHAGAALTSPPPPPPLPPHWGSSSNQGEAEVVHVSYDEQHTDQTSQVHHHSHKHSHHHHHHIQHHYHYHQHLPKQQQKPLDAKPEEQTVSNVGSMAPICGSSNLVTGQEGVLGQSGSSNGNGNVSATGSNNGSNGGHSNAQSGVAQPPPVTHGDGGNTTANCGGGAVGNGFAVAHGMIPAPDQSRFARREAALTKFRQKRKERCFEKKVRYQSRKRLAEQRPRVRGQFVRQSVYESVAGEPE